MTALELRVRRSAIRVYLKCNHHFTLDSRNSCEWGISGENEFLGLEWLNGEEPNVGRANINKRVAGNQKPVWQREATGCRADRASSLRVRCSCNSCGQESESRLPRIFPGEIQKDHSR